MMLAFMSPRKLSAYSANDLNVLSKHSSMTKAKKLDEDSEMPGWRE